MSSVAPLPLCAVMLLDFAVPPGEPPPEPVVLNTRVHRLIGRALRGLPEDARVAVQSGTSAVVCFVGDPEDALQAALVLRDQVVHRYTGKLSVRVGLNIGPVQVTLDRSDRLRVTGDGVRDALEIRDRAEPNQVLVSRSYHELLQQLNPQNAARLVDHATAGGGPPVYSAANFDSLPPPEPGPPRVVTRPAPLFHNSSLPAEELQAIEDELRRHIGPIAGALVRKVEARAGTARELRHALAAAIPQPTARESFVAAGAVGPRSPPQRATRSDSTRQVDISPAELAVIEHTLRRFVGPMAAPLMRREIDTCPHFRGFVEAIAASIGHAQQRIVFLQALQRALPERAVPLPPLVGGSVDPGA